MSSQFIFNDGEIKGRLVREGEDWFVGEGKYVNDQTTDGAPRYTGSLSEKDTELKNIWFPWICGTAKWLGITEQEKEWAKT